MTKTKHQPLSPSKIINLIYNEDIRLVEKKLQQTGVLSQQELELLQQKNWSEHQLQSACRNIFLSLAQEIELKKSGKIEFRQNDNGGKMGVGQRIKKQREGTVAGMLDSSLYLWSAKKPQNKVMLVEFKKIGAKSEVKISSAQEHQLKLFESMGFPAHITNNTVYFREVICRDIRNFIN